MSAPDALIAGRYRLVRRVGSGAMGVVWEARDERLHRSVAIKQLHAQLGLSDAEAELGKQRAMREARITARLEHPNAVSVFDVVEHDGQPCLVMQFLPSTPLSVVLRERRLLSPPESARIAGQVAAALAEAHRVGIVHRDVKPGNILIAADGTARISDFGISHALGDATLTSTGMVHGTPAYMAPEIARGGESGFASDVFGLGATLYTMVEGAPPFGTDQNAIALLHKVASGDFDPPLNSGPLKPLLLAMLRTDPEQRPQMSEVARTLADVAADSGGETPTLLLSPGSGAVEAGPSPDPTLAAPIEGAPIDQPQVDQPRVDQPRFDYAPTQTPSSQPSAQTPPVPAFQWDRSVDLPPTPRPPRPPARRSGRGLARAIGLVAALLVVVIAGVLLVPRLTEGRNTNVVPSPNATASGPATSASPSPESPTSSAPPPTARPSPTPSTPASSARPSASASAPPKTGTPTATELAQAVTSYYALMPKGIDAGWSRLTPSYQNKTGGKKSYTRFWGGIQRVSVSKAQGTAPDKAQATVTYQFADGRVVTERTAYGLRGNAGSLKINGSTVLSSSTS